MLIHDLYSIVTRTDEISPERVNLRLNPAHAIFGGHFPGQPVLPGVCMMEMIAEITGERFGKRYRISAAPLVKFLNMIDPEKNPLIDMEIQYEFSPHEVKTQGKIFRDKLIFMKFSLTLNPVE